MHDQMFQEWDRDFNIHTASVRHYVILYDVDVQRWDSDPLLAGTQPFPSPPTPYETPISWHAHILSIFNACNATYPLPMFAQQRTFHMMIIQLENRGWVSHIRNAWG